VPTLLLRPESLAKQVAAATFGRGMEVYLSQKVLDCTLSPASSSEWNIEGRVQGSGREVYDTSVTLEVSAAGKVEFFSGSCTCPVGYDCKHSVALALKAAYKSGSAVATKKQQQPDTDERLSPEELEQLKQAQLRMYREAKAARDAAQADQQVSQWLDLFGSSTNDHPEAEQDEHLVYTLSHALMGTKKVLQLSAWLTRKLQNGNKAGTWAKLKTMRRISPDTVTAADTDILNLIESQAAHTYTYHATTSQCVLAGASGLLALQLAAKTGRLYAEAKGYLQGEPLQLGANLAVAFEWQQVKAGKNPSNTEELTDPKWALVPVLGKPAEGIEWFANAPPLYLHVGSALCGALELPGVSQEHLALLMKAPPIAQSTFARHETQLLQRLAGVPLPPMIKAPEVWQGLTPKRFLHVEKVAANDVPRLGLLRATLRFDYNDLLVYAAHNQNPTLLELPSSNNESAVRVLLHRDLPAEQAAHTFLRGLRLAGDTQGQFYLPFQSNAQQQLWLRWVDEGFVTFKNAGFTLVAAPDLHDWVVRADTLDVQLAGKSDKKSGADESQSPWFDLSLGMAIDGVRHNILPLLPDLLMHLAANLQSLPDDSAITAQMPEHVYLEQKNGSYLRLPTEPLKPWLQALLELVGDKTTKELAGNSLRLSRLEALRLGASLGAGARWQGADSLREMVNQLAGRSSLPEVAVPDGLVATLRPYQLQGLSWLQFLRTRALGGVLADDMGLGKTLQTLAHVLTEKNAGRLDVPALIIAPVSLMGNWRKEAERFTPTLRTLVLHGAERHEAATNMAGHDVVIAPYSLLQRDRERWQAQAWHIVVLDEAQNIKNANSHAAQVVSELNTRHKLCLSGTPMENHLGELWSLFHFLMPGFLGSQAKFKQLFRTPIEKLGNSEQLAQLRQRVTPFMLRRNKSDVATDLPDKQEMISSVELEGKQADLYETIRLTTEKAVRDALANKGLAKSQIQILDALLKLRQVCCDPRLVPVPAAQKVKQSAKLELLMELLPELLAEGRKVLLFSQFTSMLTLIEEELTKRKLSWVKLTGQSQKRDAIIEQFTSGAVPLFLISLKAGGVGLNLTQADTVIHYDPWWNPAVETQATDRAHRIGQTKQVMVYKLVAQGTIEERILALQERKAALASSLYGGDAARKQPLFTESDLAALLKPLGA
jgi:SNF2-related domain/Helicase conserved C-terminal domain/SWIM zinc finger